MQLCNKSVYIAKVVRYDEWVNKNTSPFIFIEYLSTVFDNLGQSVLLVRVEDGRFKALLVNKTFGQTSGLPNDITGRYIDEILSPEMYKQAARHYQSAIELKQPTRYAEWIDVPNGKRMYDTKLIPIVNSVGEAEQFVVISRDITEEHMLRQQLSGATILEKMLLQNISKAFIVLDENYQILHTAQLPHSLSTWRIGAHFSEVLTGKSVRDFEEAATRAQSGEAQQEKLIPKGHKTTLQYTLSYNSSSQAYILQLNLK